MELATAKICFENRGFLALLEDAPGRREQRVATSAGHCHGDLRARFVRGLGQATAPFAGTPGKQGSFIISGSQRPRPPAALCSHSLCTGREDTFRQRTRRQERAKEGKLPPARCPIADGVRTSSELVRQHVDSRCFVNQNQQAPKTPRPESRRESWYCSVASTCTPWSFLLKKKCIDPIYTCAFI